MANFFIDRTNLRKFNARATSSRNYYASYSPPAKWWILEIKRSNSLIQDLLSRSSSVDGIRFTTTNLANPATATISISAYNSGDSTGNGVILRNAVIDIFNLSPPRGTSTIDGFVVGIGKVMRTAEIIIMVQAFGRNASGEIITTGGGGDNLTPCRIPAP